MYTENKQAIENFFKALRQLDEKLEQKGWGGCSRIHYELEINQLKRSLWESRAMAARSIELASQILCDESLFTWDQRQAKMELTRLGDQETRNRWEKTHNQLNRERCAQLVLKAMASVEVLPIPPPTPEVIRRSRKAWEHQLGSELPSGSPHPLESKP